jgi:hypothetical protein
MIGAVALAFALAALPATFAQLAADATATLTSRFWAGDGRWRACDDPRCPAGNADWGNDSLTAVLWLRWTTTHDAALVPYFRALAHSAPRYGPCNGTDCRGWSDVPAWDAVAASRVYDVTHDDAALRDARAAYERVVSSDRYARGACPEIDYQRPDAASGGLKTLETDANLVLAAVLLAARTGEPRYLADARRRYDAVRRRFFDPRRGLYTVYVFDDGDACRALPGRFFASVNGTMIDAGRALARATHAHRFADDARLTTRAIAQLDDAHGIFANLQAENDVVAPLVIAMLHEARDDPFARAWILRNAAAAAGARNAAGSYGRFFDGPPPHGTVTAWQTNGGLALAVAAAALAPQERVAAGDAWSRAGKRDVAIGVPGTFRFTGSGIALLGALGARCCEAGRAAVRIDGAPTADATGIWQNKSSLGRTLPDATLFAWRWPRRSSHVLEFVAEEPNAKEGGPFLDVRRVLILP